MTSTSQNGASYQPVTTTQSSPRSSVDAESEHPDEDFALLSDDASLLSDDIELDDIASAPEGRDAGIGSGSAAGAPRPGGNPKPTGAGGEGYQTALSPWQTAAAYRPAVCWSMVMSLCIVMEGYDLILLNSFMAHPQFTKKFGQYVNSKDGYQVSPTWMGILPNSSAVGSFVGATFSGWLVDRFGHRNVAIGSLFVLSGLLSISFTSQHVIQLMIGQLLSGVPFGIFATSAGTYAFELLPVAIRAVAFVWTNACFIIGHFLASAVIESCLGLTGDWSFRAPMAIQWVWPIVLVPALFFAPESPAFLVRKGRIDEAKKTLQRLQSNKANSMDAKSRLVEIIRTDRIEEKYHLGTTYRDCFRGVERRRTEIACMAFAGQVFSGAPFAYNGVYFFRLLGFSARVVFLFSLSCLGLALVGVFTNLVLLKYFGRRTIYVGGMFALSIILLVVGILNQLMGVSETIRTNILWIEVALIIVWTFAFQLSIGNLGWLIPGEVSSQRLRHKTVCVARNAYYMVQIIGTLLSPLLMSPRGLNLRGSTAFFWAATAFMTFVWAFFRLAETRDLSPADLDRLFHRQTPTRNFCRSEIEAIDAEEEEEEEGDKESLPSSLSFSSFA